MARVTLTTAHLNAKNPAKPVELADALSPLRLSMRPTGKSFTCRVRVAGRQRNVTIGAVETMTLADARAKAKAVALAAKNGEDPAGERIEENKRARSGELLVETVAEGWLKHLGKHRDAKTLQNYRSAWNCHLKPRLEGKRLDLVRRPMLQSIINDLVHDDKPGAARTAAKAIKSLVAYGIADGVLDLDNDPTTRLVIPADGERERTLNDSEVAILWSALDRLDIRRRAFFRLALLTGARRGELEQLTAAQLDRTRGEWTIPSEITKAGQSGRVLPLPALAWEIINTLPKTAPTARMFATNTADSRGKDKLDKAIVAELTERKIAEPFEDFVVHDLRRTTASGMGKCRVQPVVIEAVIGHLSGAARGGSVAAIYNRYGYHDEKREALKVWSEYVAKLVGANVRKLKRAG